MIAAPPEGSRTLCELQCRLGKFVPLECLGARGGICS